MPGTTKRLIFSSLTTSLLALFASASNAAEEVRSCGPFIPLVDDSNLIMEAGAVERHQDNLYLLTDKASVQYRQTLISADELTLNNAEKTVETTAPFTLFTTHQNIKGKGAYLDLANERARLDQASYTTCHSDRPFWSLGVEQLNLDRQNNHGSARNVKVRILNVPVAYVPYITFPLGKRKSGFISPDISSASRTGFDLATPFYWNIAPAMDSTITPRFMSQRGFLLRGEFRYMTRASYGKTWVEYLPHDLDRATDRQHVAWQHTTRSRANGLLKMHVQHVSDTDFFRDLGNDFKGSSSRAINRYARYSAFGHHWYLYSSVNDYQILNGAAEPYRRLPQLRFHSAKSFGPLRPSLDTRYLYLSHNAENDLQAVDLLPALSLNLNHPAFYMRSSAQWLARRTLNTGAVRTLDLPEVSIDSAFFLDRYRNTSAETIKPRLFYLWREAETSTVFPDITSLYMQDSFLRPFDTSHITGYGTLPDEHRLSGGLEYQRISDDGNTLILSAAHTLQLSDRQGVIDDMLSNQGDMATSVTLEWNPHQSLGLVLQQDRNWQKAGAEDTLFRVKYAGNSSSLNLSYIDRDLANDAVLTGTGSLRLSSRWQTLGRVSYIPEQQDIQELMFGGEFQNCCWRAQLAAQAYRYRLDSPFDYRLGLLLELKGLTNIGKDWFNETQKDLF